MSDCEHCDAHDGLFIHGVQKSRDDQNDKLVFKTMHVTCEVQPGPNSDLWKDADLKHGEHYYVEIGVYRPKPLRSLNVLYEEWCRDPNLLTTAETDRLENALTRLDELDEDRG